MSRIIRFDSKYIEGEATYEGTEMVCVPKAKYGEVLLGFRTDTGIASFASLKFHDGTAKSADRVFDMASEIGEEIALLWNEKYGKQVKS